MYKSTHSSGVK